MRKIDHLHRLIPCDSRCWPCRRRGSNGAFCCRRYRRRRARYGLRFLFEAVHRDVSAPERRTRPRADPTPSSRSRTRACHLTEMKSQTKKMNRKNDAVRNDASVQNYQEVKYLHLHGLKNILCRLTIITMRSFYFIIFFIWKNIEYLYWQGIFGVIIWILNRVESSEISGILLIVFFILKFF